MSPHALRSESLGQRQPLDLSKFAVTRNAFIPEDSLPKMLSDSHYEPWELVAHNLPELIQSGRVHVAIRELPILSTECLKSEAEWRRAYVILSFFAHAYIWGGEKPEEILPPSVTVPYLRVSAHLELPPTLTYAGANLWNFSCKGDDFTNLEDLSTLLSFTGTESESWFLLISVAMEAKAGYILHTMIRALEAVKTRDYQVIIEGLEELKSCIENVGALLERMYERCEPMIFYHQIRPFLAGSMNMEAAGLPRGVFYDEGNGKGEWRQLRGGSNGQSSLIQFFDVVLGVDHNGHSATEKSFHSEVRDYMPGPHAKFLVHAARLGSIRELALVTPVREEQHLLRAAYTAATDALTQFRNKHIQIVTRYIILPSKQPWSGPTRQNLASSSTEKKGEGLTGTGGTQLLPFLKQSRDETNFAGKLEKS
ncbi:indoleamine 2,3-dioxygenase pyrrole 2,3-dioxygenase [Trichoderma arundinaceum]|uniref:Indoleamine 2,3-dioxygenase pyrrole 2,3-dioxygenase n=1 Tax=Trichoderma arundinaceum TaxID=490622 RepID=A0A395N916_TRIAR|nr:indoleamine 2,3-dioxygenase pyrrole 2,3-dioxygenase [Trichoderma arundinaceum]